MTDRAPESACDGCGQPRAFETVQVPGLGLRHFPIDCPCEAEAHRERRARREARLRELLGPAGIGPRHREASFETFEVTPHSAPIVEICRTFVARVPDGGRGLTLAGPPGTGRTHLGVAITRALVERDVLALMFNVPAFFRSGRQQLRAAPERFDALVDLLCR
ncbi:MAG: hypothetical protein L0027_16385, partial [Candidatus Rokubacteria bacterium]|nr:hypothetical protein [Candidatus Rokubacteria bacterium]